MGSPSWRLYPYSNVSSVNKRSQISSKWVCGNDRPLSSWWRKCENILGRAIKLDWRERATTVQCQRSQVHQLLPRIRCSQVWRCLSSHLYSHRRHLERWYSLLKLWVCRVNVACYNSRSRDLCFNPRSIFLLLERPNLYAFQLDWRRTRSIGFLWSLPLLWCCDKRMVRRRRSRLWVLGYLMVLSDCLCEILSHNEVLWLCETNYDD